MNELNTRKTTTVLTKATQIYALMLTSPRTTLTPTAGKTVLTPVKATTFKTKKTPTTPKSNVAQTTEMTMITPTTIMTTKMIIRATNTLTKRIVTSSPM